MRKHTVVSLSVMVVLVFAATLVPSQAQELRGSFALPMEARWGQFALAPGDYTFSMARAPNSTGALLLRRNGISLGYILTATRGNESSSQSSLLLEQSDGTYSVRALRIPEVGVFTYNVPKPKARQVAQRSTAIPVNASGK